MLSLKQLRIFLQFILGLQPSTTPPPEFQNNPYRLSDDLLFEICRHVTESSTRDALNMARAVSTFGQHFDFLEDVLTTTRIVPPSVQHASPPLV